MGNKDDYAKGILLHQWVETVDWDKLTADFVVLRLGQTGYPNYATGEYVDQKYAEWVQKAYEKGLPVLAWYELYPKIYADTAWQVDDFSRWYGRAQDMTMQVVDRMIANRPYFHGVIVSVSPGTYNAAGKTYDASAKWVSRSLLRAKDLIGAAYPGKVIWGEFPPDMIDKAEWDTQGLLLEDAAHWPRTSAWSSGAAGQTVNGALDLDALTYPEEHMPMYTMATRTGSLWRVKPVTWDGAKTKAGGNIPLWAYLYYGSKESLYRSIGFTPGVIPDPIDPDPTPDPEPGTGTGADMTETNALLREIINMLEPISAFFARFK